MNINSTILGQIIAFIFFVFFCMKYIWPPLIKIIEIRQKEIIDGINFTANAKSELEKTKKQIANDLYQAKIKAEKIIQQANILKKNIIEQAKVEAENKSKQILLKTKEDIKIEYLQQYKKLRTNITNLILLGVEKIIKKSLNKNSHNEIINKIITQL